MRSLLKTKEHKRGYTLLFAVLTAALVLGVAVFILSISRGQYILSSTARESTYEIYAADSGIECASNALLSFSTSTISGSPNVTIVCAGKTKDIIGADSGYSNTTINSLFSASQYSTYIDLGDGRCAKLTFIKGFNKQTGGDVVTQIESRGYNYCKGGGAGPDTSNPRVVERAMRLTYTGQ